MTLGAVLFATIALIAGPSTDKIAQSLEKDPVYIGVQVGELGVTNDTAGVLEEQLSSSDNVVIVMLPATTGDPVIIARDINKKLGGKKIVGLSLGERTAAWSSTLPAGVASELMQRATTVSTTTEETLGTFIQNVHDWQKAHPMAEASQPPEKKSHALAIFLGGFLVLAFIILAVLLVPLLLSRGEEDEVKIKKSPDEVRDPLNRLLDARGCIDNTSLTAELTQICRDTESYFQRRKADDADTDAFKRHLTSLADVIDQYVDIQDNPRFYKEPAAFMAKGEQAVTDFGTYVLEAIQRDGRSGLTNFRVNTDILSAQRFAGG